MDYFVFLPPSSDYLQKAIIIQNYRIHQSMNYNET